MNDASANNSRNGNVIGERIASMQQIINDHTNQLRDLTTTGKDLQISNAEISLMQKNSSEEVREIRRQHNDFVKTQRMRSQKTDEAIKELTTIVNENTVKLAEDYGRHQEREKFTRIYVGLLIALATLVTNLFTLYLKT